MELKLKKIKLLKEYFKKNPQILMAFVFGSKAKDREMRESDWDIGVYFKPKEYLEIETSFDYPEKGMWSNLVDILETDNVDLAILNRAKASLVYNVLREGIPLVIKDKKFYFALLSKVSYEAIDWWDFVDKFWKISQEAHSISKEAKTQIKEYLDFLTKEFEEIKEIKNISREDYFKDSFKQKIIERWIERIVMSLIDIAQIILASEKKRIPQGYKDVLKVFITLYVDPSIADQFSEFAKLRNIVAHEYLDIKWERIRKFIREAEKLYPKFIGKVKMFLKKDVK